MHEMYAKIQKIANEPWFEELYDSFAGRGDVQDGGIFGSDYRGFGTVLYISPDSVRTQIIFDDGYVLNEETFDTLKEACIHIICVVDNIYEICSTLQKRSI